MKFIADLHIHSRFSAATSKDADLEHFYRWARLKGINIVATADFTHPAWFKELKEKLIPTDDGLFVLKKDIIDNEEKFLSSFNIAPSVVKFILSSEISTIYKKNGKTRKLHIVVCFNSLEKASLYSSNLAKIGNISYDGRPIIGLDAKDLLSIVLDISSDSIFIPAHIWTPWFSLFGSNSGFDSIEECFEDLSSEITALETGLSSDPSMNWRLSELDRFSLVSNSDAHSPSNLGREVNLFDTELSYDSIRKNLKDPKSKEFTGTIEFFPEEGKYHYDGHRFCNINLSPVESEKLNNICPVCRKPLTVGVMHRVMELADRPEGFIPPHARRFEKLVPLSIVISEAFGKISVKKREEIYFNLIKKIGPEFYILREAPFDLLKKTAGPLVAEAIFAVREQKIKWTPGFDGEYGKVKIFDEEKRQQLMQQQSLFFFSPLPELEKKSEKLLSKKKITPQIEHTTVTLNENQMMIVKSSLPSCVIAGPGTGKTKILIEKIRFLIESKIDPQSVVALTFTNKAAEELKNRIGNVNIFSGTVHSFALHIIRLSGINAKIIDETGTKIILKKLFPFSDCERLIKDFSKIRGTLSPYEYPDDNNLKIWLEWLEKNNSLDFDGIIAKAFILIDKNPLVLSGFKFLFVDEFQDINRMQYLFLHKVAKIFDENIFVIGDPDQSIYRFRGADLDVFDNFFNDFKNAKRYYLFDNYRSSGIILNAADRLMKRDLTLRPFFNKKGSITLHSFNSEKKEASFVTEKIIELLKGRDMLESEKLNLSVDAISLNSIGVLARTELQLRTVADFLDREGIPWKLRGGRLGIYSPQAQRLINILRLYLDSEDTQATLFFDNEKDKILSFVKELKKESLTTSELLVRIVDSQKISDVDELLSLSEGFEDVESFFKNILSPVDESFETSRKKISPESVSLLTLHASKGLEFVCVFILGLNETLIPYYYKDISEEELEEERRLLYVGITRASEKVFLLCRNDLPYSRFLELIKPERISETKRKTAYQLELFQNTEKRKKK